MAPRNSLARSDEGDRRGSYPLADELAAIADGVAAKARAVIEKYEQRTAPHVTNVDRGE